MAQHVEGTTPMDVDQLLPCVKCNKGILHGGNVCFYEVTIVQAIADMQNIQRMHGLEQMMNGSVPLARVFSGDNTVAHRLGQPKRVLICQECALAGRDPIALLLED